MNRYVDKLVKFVRFGIDLATLSTCRRTKNGAVVFPCNCSAVYAIGYNGPARGLPNDGCTGVKGECGCAHAEGNAIAKLDPQRAKPCIIYCTSMPCAWCANLIINVRVVVGVVYSAEYRSEHGRKLLLQAGIPFVGVRLLFESGLNFEAPIYDTLRQWRKAGTVV